jgi:hypothetical protein
MNSETMYYNALNTVIGHFQACDAWAEFARTADGEAERQRGQYKALRAKVRAVVGYDREMDRLVKERK